VRRPEKNAVVTGGEFGDSDGPRGSRARFAPMKIKSAVFEVSVPDLKSCPNWNRPEFALIGRSNVGKSSLINLLAEQRALAMVSDKPGKTKLINFFIMNGSWCRRGSAGLRLRERLETGPASGSIRRWRTIWKTGKRCGAVSALIDSRLEPQQIDLDFSPVARQLLDALCAGLHQGRQAVGHADGGESEGLYGETGRMAGGAAAVYREFVED